MTDKGRIIATVLRELAQEVESNDQLAERVGGLLLTKSRRGKTNRIEDNLPNLFEIFRDEGAENLHKKLEASNIEQLKALIRKYALDTTKRSLRWQNREKLIDFLCDRIASCSRKGDVFLHST